MSVAFSLVFDFDFMVFSISPPFVSTDHRALCEADPFSRFWIQICSIIGTRFTHGLFRIWRADFYRISKLMWATS